MAENEMEKMIEEALGITQDLQRHEDGEVCVVSHPDAGGPCGRPATRLVWELPFCEIHGAEAEAAARDEIAEELQDKLDIIARAENDLQTPNRVLVDFLRRFGIRGESPLGGSEHTGGAEVHDEALKRAYPPLEGRADPDTVAFDYASDYPGDGPVDWWAERRWLLCRFMRQAGERGLPELVEELEPLRERASAQLVQAEDDYQRGYVAPRLAERAAEEEAAAR